MLPAVGYIVTHISTSQWDNINKRINHFLEYATTHPYAKVTYPKMDMHLWFHIDASYLTEPRARSCAGGYHCFSIKPKLPIQSDDPPPKHNHPLLFLSKVIDSVMSSIQESKAGGGYINSKEALPIHQTEIEMGHLQEQTTLQLDNKCVHGILTRVPKQKQSKGTYIRFYWLRDRSIEKKFHTH